MAKDTGKEIPITDRAQKIDELIDGGKWSEAQRGFLENLPEHNFNELLSVPVKDQPVVKDELDELIENLSETEFSDELDTYPIKIKNKETGALIPYTLRELDASGRSEYLDFQAKKAKFNNEGQVTGIKDMKGLEVKALTLSLIGPDGKPVPESIINTWPGKLIGKFAKIVLRISGLDNKAEVRAKNS